MLPKGFGNGNMKFLHKSTTTGACRFISLILVAAILASAWVSWARSCVPDDCMEYQSALKAIDKAKAGAATRTTMRAMFDKTAQIDDIKSILWQGPG
jgi:hypothetical protein